MFRSFVSGRLPGRRPGGAHLISVSEGCAGRQLPCGSCAVGLRSACVPSALVALGPSVPGGLWAVTGVSTPRGARAVSNRVANGPSVPRLAHGPSVPDWLTGRQFPDGARAVNPRLAHGPSVPGCPRAVSTPDGARAVSPRLAHGPSVPGWRTGRQSPRVACSPRLSAHCFRVLARLVCDGVGCRSGISGVGSSPRVIGFDSVRVGDWECPSRLTGPLVAALRRAVGAPRGRVGSAESPSHSRFGWPAAAGSLTNGRGTC